jgi:hypothetical protein
MIAEQWMTKFGVVSFALCLHETCLAQITPDIALLSRHCISVDNVL